MGQCTIYEEGTKSYHRRTVGALYHDLAGIELIFKLLGILSMYQDYLDHGEGSSVKSIDMVAQE